MPKIELGKEYQTLDAREVRIYATDGTATQPIHGAYRSANGTEWLLTYWTSNGGFCSDEKPSLLNLVEKPRTYEFWVNVYPKTTSAHPTKEEADNSADKYHRVACIRVTAREGEGI